MRGKPRCFHKKWRISNKNCQIFNENFQIKEPNFLSDLAKFQAKITKFQAKIAIYQKWNSQITSKNNQLLKEIAKFIIYEKPCSSGHKFDPRFKPSCTGSVSENALKMNRATFSRVDSRRKIRKNQVNCFLSRWWLFLKLKRAWKQQKVDWTVSIISVWNQFLEED